MNPSNPANPTKLTKTILITVDLEDWFQVENLRPTFPIATWNSCEIRVESSTHKLLDLFDRYHVQATFFVLGWLADKRPDLIKEIHQRGHEIASHGYNHQLCSEVSVSALREDIHKSKMALEDISGQAVLGYRAPNFSITEELVDILAELGFMYDSSYNSFALNRRHGKANDLFSLSSESRLIAQNGIIELPMSNLNIAGRVIPWSGGGYFRFWPTSLFYLGVNHILKDTGHYTFYCHPWEADPAQPRAKGIGMLSSFRHYLNLDQTLNRLDRFFSRFQNCSFAPCNHYLGDSISAGWSNRTTSNNLRGRNLDGLPYENSNFDITYRTGINSLWGSRSGPA
jgi:polysaccharide deacetylase family protein (PEP-CTERM system associated)